MEKILFNILKLSLPGQEKAELIVKKLIYQLINIYFMLQYKSGYIKLHLDAIGSHKTFLIPIYIIS